MKRIPTTLAAALLASSLAGGVALAADPGASTQAGEATAGGTAQTAPGGPSVGDMDTNAQRAHSPSGNTGTDSTGTTGNAGATGNADTTGNAGAATGSGAGTMGSDTAGASGAAGSSGAAAGGNQEMAASGDTRDWSQIDTNSDNLIGPEEMEEALKATGPQAGQQR